MSLLKNIFSRKQSSPSSDQERTKKESRKKTVTNPIFVPGVSRKPTSPLNDQVWRLILFVFGGCVGIWLLWFLGGFDRIFSLWITAILSSATWIAAVRLLLLDSRKKKFWIIWLSLGFLLVVLFSSAGGIWIAGVSFSFIFLLFRKYRPLRHLTSRRLTGLFLLGLFLFTLITFGFIPRKIGEVQILTQAEEIVPAPLKPGNFFLLGKSINSYALGSLRIFWFFSLFFLFFNIRLHFLKLKPKLAISAFMLVVVPLFLVTVMGLLTLYATLGESRAIRAGNILKDWAELAVKDENFVHSLSEHSFVFDTRKGNVFQQGDIPDWVPGLRIFLSGHASWILR